MAGGKLNDAPLCKCGAPCPKRPLQDLYRPRCDRCEDAMIRARKYESRVRSKARRMTRTMLGSQKP